MIKLADITQKIRSKNAGPFWITIDIFCADDAEYTRAVVAANSDRIAHALGISVSDLKRYDLPDLRVIKFHRGSRRCTRPPDLLYSHH